MVWQTKKSTLLKILWHAKLCLLRRNEPTAASHTHMQEKLQACKQASAAPLTLHISKGWHAVKLCVSVGGTQVIRCWVSANVCKRIISAVEVGERNSSKFCKRCLFLDFWWLGRKVNVNLNLMALRHFTYLKEIVWHFGKWVCNFSIYSHTPLKKKHNFLHFHFCPD